MHVVGMLAAPLFLAIAALLPIRRIILELPTVIVSSSLTLALARATNNLVRMILRRVEQLSTVRTAGARHTHSSHSQDVLGCRCYTRERDHEEGGPVSKPPISYPLKRLSDLSGGGRLTALSLYRNPLDDIACNFLLPPVV
jgi:hypothetical protein